MASCFLFYLAHCSKYCWLNFVFVQGSVFGLAAMAEVVVERPETIFIGTANRVAKGVEHVWRYKLTFVGAERMYVCMEPPSTTHAGDLMFIMEDVVEGNKPRFGRMECTSGRQMMCGAEPPTQKKWKNHSGKRRASWFAHAMRCSCGTLNPFASLDSTAFWRGGLMHVVCVCLCVWNYRRFASLDLTAFWRGGPMHWGRWHLQAQSCHGYYFCCVVCGKYRVCRAAFFGEAVDVRFWFWYVRKNVRRYVRKHVQRYVRKNVRRYVRKNVKRYVRKMPERISEDMSERMSTDMSERMSEEISEDMSERMSKDMSERTSEDCFQSVCEVESNRTHFRRWVVCLPSPDPIRLT